MKCSVEPAHLATSLCLCCSPPLPFCSSCLTNHSQSANKSPKFQPPTCNRCSQSQAEVICGCEMPTVPLCQPCGFAHIKAAPSISHFFLPVSLSAQVTTVQEAEQQCLRLSHENYLRSSICSRIDATIADLCTRFHTVKSAFDSQVRELRAIKEMLQGGCLSGDLVSNQVAALLRIGELDALFQRKDSCFDETLGIAYDSVLLPAIREMLEATAHARKDGLSMDISTEPKEPIVCFRDCREYAESNKRMLDMERRIEKMPADSDLREIHAEIQALETRLQSAIHQTHSQSLILKETMLNPGQFQSCAELLIANPTRKQRLLLTFDTQISLMLIALQRHKLQSNHLRDFELCLREQSRDMAETLKYLCENMIDYLAETPTEQTRINSEKLLTTLMEKGINRENVDNWKTLIHVLTRIERIPTDIEGLAAFSDQPQQTMLVEVRTDHIRVFDCIEKQWRNKVAVSQILRVSNYSSSCLLQNRNVFICGANNPYSANVYEIHTETGAVRKLSDLSAVNSLMGLIPYFNWVYSFGGHIGSDLKRAEKYSLATDKWVSLPDMITTRSCFNPCLYRHLMYICGGHAVSVSEIFSPVTEKYTALDFSVPEKNHTRNIIIDDEMIILHPTNITRLDLASRMPPQSQVRTSGAALSSMSPIVIASMLWFSRYPDGTIIRVNLEKNITDEVAPYPTG